MNIDLLSLPLQYVLIASCMQTHVSGKKHQKAQNERKCVEGITVKRHHMSWEDMKLEDDESKNKPTLQSEKKHLAFEPLKSRVQCIPIPRQSKSPDLAASPSRSYLARPRPGGKQADGISDKGFNGNIRKLDSIPENGSKQLYADSPANVQPKRSVKSTETLLPLELGSTKVQLHNNGELQTEPCNAACRKSKGVPELVSVSANAAIKLQKRSYQVTKVS